jgi:ribosome-binding factor A
MRRREKKPPSQRQLRIGEELRHALAWIVERGDLRDPELGPGRFTVTEVRAAPDLRRATVFVAPLGGGDADPLLDALARARPFLRHRVAKSVTLKYMPDFSFKADDTFDTASRIDQLLKSSPPRGKDT